VRGSCRPPLRWLGYTPIPHIICHSSYCIFLALFFNFIKIFLFCFYLFPFLLLFSVLQVPKHDFTLDPPFCFLFFVFPCFFNSCWQSTYPAIFLPFSQKIALWQIYKKYKKTASFVFLIKILTENIFSFCRIISGFQKILFKLLSFN